MGVAHAISCFAISFKTFAFLIEKRGVLFMKVNELKPKQAVPEITLEVVSKAEPREFANDRGSGKVCSAAAKDDTGEVKLSLWNEQCEQINEGDKIKIENGWCSEYQGEKQVSTGKFGKVEKVK